MDRPSSDIAGCRRAHERLLAAVADLTDGQVRAPSSLPGWSVGHVLSHLARNADSMVRRVEAAALGMVADQYEGGPAGRDADIEAGAGRSAEALIVDVREASARADAAFDACPDEAWGRMTGNVRGGQLPVGQLPFRRWREAETHLIDLGIGFTSADFSPELAERWLPGLLAAAPGRTDGRALVGWLLRRGPAPDLGPF